MAISAAEADDALGYMSVGGTLSDTAKEVRDLLAADCRAKFGAQNVTVGNKAVAVDGLDGSRADVDLVPAFHLRYVTKGSFGEYYTQNGVGIIGADGSETWNFPQQHHENGKSKRSRTTHRFKSLVRSLKRLNYELCELGAINRRLPSFLIECLVYLVEDEYFNVAVDDRYDRFRRVVERVAKLLEHDDIEAEALEVNNIKFLFRPKQAWTLADARNFLAAANARLNA